ncbi:LLM class flavin-dependent oxidoreductase [Streptomyces sp. PA03-5A]|nr:LLM class flavin-dependent oxidoreductase [Streptomyces sp. PA03-5A]
MTSTALTRLTGAHQRLTLGLELPLDNDWGAGRRAADQQAGRPFGVPDLSGHADLARLADRLGFSALWLRDVPVYDPLAFGDAGSVFDVFAYLGHLAALTEHVVLGTSAVVLPLRSPLHVAKAAATVDVLSAGRLVLGLASGDRPVEYPLFGADFDGRGQAFRDGVRTLRAAWATPAPGLGLTLPGTGLRAERRIDVLPKPVGGDIPIAVAGSARQTPEWIAGHADAGLNDPRPLDALRDDVQRWREVQALPHAHAARPGRGPRGPAGADPPRPAYRAHRPRRTPGRDGGPGRRPRLPQPPSGGPPGRGGTARTRRGGPAPLPRALTRRRAPSGTGAAHPPRTRGGQRCRGLRPGGCSGA